jgi:hypothetical protein
MDHQVYIGGKLYIIFSEFIDAECYGFKDRQVLIQHFSFHCHLRIALLIIYSQQPGEHLLSCGDDEQQQLSLPAPLYDVTPRDVPP